MGTLKEFEARYAFSAPELCSRILDRHRETIRIKKPHVAVPNLVRIVETTLSIANRKGFHSMSLRDLAERSGLSMGALYAYFDSKETLLLMILGQVAAAVEETLSTPPTPFANDPRGRLRWILETHVFLSEVMQPWFAFAYLEAKAFPREGRDLALRSEGATEALIAETLRDGIAGGMFTIDDPGMTAALIKPMLQDWYVKRGKYRHRGVTPERYARSLISFVEAAVCTRAVAAHPRSTEAAGSDQ